MDKKTRTAWTVATILAVLFVVMTVMWANAAGYISFGGKDLVHIRTQVTKSCNGPEDLGSAECRDALRELTRALKKFESALKDIPKESSGPTIEGATTSTVQFGQ